MVNTSQNLSVGMYLAQGMPRPLATSATAVYVLEPKNSGGNELTKFPKPQ